MTDFEDFKKLVKGMKAVYTSQSFLPDAEAVGVWYGLLKDIPYPALSTAVQKHMLTSRFPPTIADIRECAAENASDTGDWSEGWERFLEAVRRYGYYRKEEALASLDDVTRTTVRRLGWKDLCTSENLMADRANFRMVYEQEKSKAKHGAMLSDNLKVRIAALQGRTVKALENV